MEKVVEITRYGPPDVLRVREVAAAEPGPSEVAIAVHAAGVNFADVMGRLGLYDPAPPPPYVPGFEVAGTIAALGPGVEGWSVGDRVIGGTRFGGYATRIVTHVERVMPLPDGWSFVAGAGLLATYATAHHALVTLGRVSPGARVLIHAGAGGLGTACIQLAVHLGARVVATAGGADKAAFCETHGAHAGIDYKRRDWPQRARDAADDRGFDVIVDSVIGPTFKHSYDLLKPMGHLVLCGAASFTPRRRRNYLVLAAKWLALPRINLIDLIPSNRTVSGFNLLLLWDEPGYMTSLGEALTELALSGAFKPVIDREWPLSAAHEAHAYMQARRTRGKLVLVTR